MSRQDVASVIGRAAIDAKFLKALQANPEQALKRSNVELTNQEMEAVKGIDFAALNTFHKTVTPNIHAFFDTKGV